jgi:hypothetical protein
MFDARYWAIAAARIIAVADIIQLSAFGGRGEMAGAGNG